MRQNLKLSTPREVLLTIGANDSLMKPESAQILFMVICVLAAISEVNSDINIA